MLSEKQVQDSIIDLFKFHGLYIQRINSGTVQNMQTGSWLRLASRGHSDIIAADKQNRICFIEVKSESGKLSNDQISFLREQNKKNRRWCVCVSYQDAAKFLEDETFHGPEKHVAEVLDESKKFIFQNPNKTRMSAEEIRQFNEWSDRYPQGKK